MGLSKNLVDAKIKLEKDPLYEKYESGGYLRGHIPGRYHREKQKIVFCKNSLT